MVLQSFIAFEQRAKAWEFLSFHNLSRASPNLVLCAFDCKFLFLSYKAIKGVGEALPRLLEP
jgi:hypothetical protein